MGGGSYRQLSAARIAHAAVASKLLPPPRGKGAAGAAPRRQNRRIRSVALDPIVARRPPSSPYDRALPPTGGELNPTRAVTITIHMTICV